MNTAPAIIAFLLAFLTGTLPLAAENDTDQRAKVRALVANKLNAEYPSLFEIYKTCTRTRNSPYGGEDRRAGRGELRTLGFQVTEKVGHTGVVGVLTNGPGPTVLVRADMDGLPIKENSGVPYASTDS